MRAVLMVVRKVSGGSERAVAVPALLADRSGALAEEGSSARPDSMATPLPCACVL